MSIHVAENEDDIYEVTCDSCFTTISVYADNEDEARDAAENFDWGYDVTTQEDVCDECSSW